MSSKLKNIDYDQVRKNIKNNSRLLRDYFKKNQIFIKQSSGRKQSSMFAFKHFDKLAWKLEPHSLLEYHQILNLLKDKVFYEKDIIKRLKLQ